MFDFLKRSYAVVNLDAVRHNITAIRAHLLPTTKLIAVVKADGYGHGSGPVSRELSEIGVDLFAVSNLEEALSLRRGGICEPILILGITPPSLADELISHQIIQTVFSLEYAKALSSEAARHGKQIAVHFKVDTGMGRLGFQGIAACPEIIEAYHLTGLNVQGIFTHFSSADDLSPQGIAYTKEQFQKFSGVLKALQSQNICFAMRHCCNSAATLLYPEMQLDAVRPGILLFGHNPSPHMGIDWGLMPAMQLKAVVSMVKQVPPGEAISYGRSYVTSRETTIATLPIGYADGYQRALGNRARVLIKGKFAPVVGNVCMDQLMIDVTDIPGVQREDEATLFGQDGDQMLPIEEVASLSGTISYEVMCLIGKRVPRVYYKNGIQVGSMDYTRLV